MLASNSTINQAIAIISERGLDKFRCCLTGAPYATIESDEIVISLEGDVANSPSITVDRLVDNWELRSLSFNSQKAPYLRNASPKALLPLINRGRDGQVRVMTYLLTRLLYPTSDKSDSEFMRERMLFAMGLHDAAMKWEYKIVATYVQNLVAIDSYCSMPQWHKLWAFDSRLSQVGKHQAPRAVQNTFNDPMALIDDHVRVQKLIMFMFILMIYVNGTDGVAGYSGNRQSQNILFLTAPDVHSGVIPDFQMDLSQADIDRAAKARAINAHEGVKIAWSSIHGKGTIAGANKPSRPKAAPKDESKAAPVKKFDVAANAAFQKIRATLAFSNAAAAIANLKKG